MTSSSDARSADPRCLGCWQRKSAHVAGSNGVLECPPTIRYFTPCEHKETQGWGMLGSDGSYNGETWCTKCGDQITFKKGAT
jgi:hypothetical protein